MQLYKRLQEERMIPRVLFIASGLPILLISVLSMYLYYPMRSEKPEYARLTNQGILVFIFTMIHFLGGCLSLKRKKIDYSIYKPLAACIIWNGLLILTVLIFVNSICEYTEVWTMKMIVVTLTALFTVLVMLQVSVHWKLYKNGRKGRDLDSICIT